MRRAEVLGLPAEMIATGGSMAGTSATRVETGQSRGSQITPNAGIGRSMFLSFKPAAVFKRGLHAAGHGFLHRSGDQDTSGRSLLLKPRRDVHGVAV